MKQQNVTTRGFTILELLISVIIIGILVAIIIPVLSNRAADARLAAAQADIDAIQNAEQHAAIDTGFYYRLYVLDDTPGGDGIRPDIPSTSGRDRIDGVRDENRRVDTGASGLQEHLFIDIKEGTILASGPTLYARLTSNETEFNWRGPYINIHKKAPSPEELGTPPAGTDWPPAGSPVDPWGNAYLLFTKAGLVKEPQGRIVTTVQAADGSNYNALVFDRPTILSLGANGLPGDGGTTGFGQGDDIYRHF